MRLLALCLLLVLPAAAEDLDASRARFPPEVTRALLQGQLTAPEGFDAAIAEEIGKERLAQLRSGQAEVEGRENDVAALVLVRIGAKPMKAPAGGPREGPGEIAVEKLDSSYAAAEGKTSGFFRTGQPADLALSSMGFDEAGGPLLFNHPAGIATDGTRLFLADTYNNRVLIWSKLPAGNEPPDLVLGQKDFHGNSSGDGRDRMNFPITCASDGKRLLVADTNNDRILIWNEVPKANGAPADLVLGGGPPARGLQHDRVMWPWGVWSDGTRVAVSSTRAGSVLVWSAFPTDDGQSPDIVLTAGGKMGTPRQITADGTRLIVGDHNARDQRAEHGSWVWKSWPKESETDCDAFWTDPKDKMGMWLRGTFAADGGLFLLGNGLHIWKGFPKDGTKPPDLSLTRFNFHSGDHTGVAVAGGRMYVCCGNLNMVVGYSAIPTTASAMPDFAIGSADVKTNTLETNFIISNPVPASDGKHLFVSSDFDRALYVWKRIPDASAAHPDLVYHLDGGALGVALHGETLATAGRTSVLVWDRLPLEGNLPDRRFDGGIGEVRFQELRGVAVDEKYFYLADGLAGRVYVWKGMPTGDESPFCELAVDNPWRVMSDGTWLVVGTGDKQVVHLWEVASLGPSARSRRLTGPGEGQRFNWVQTAFASCGHLFVAECGMHRVHCWERVEDALAGKAPDAVLGQADALGISAATARDRLFDPATAWFDGTWLWVGETKFSERLLRFSPGR